MFVKMLTKELQQKKQIFSECLNKSKLFGIVENITQATRCPYLIIFETLNAKLSVKYLVVGFSCFCMDGNFHLAGVVLERR